MKLDINYKKNDGTFVKVFTQQQYLCWRFLKDASQLTNWSGEIKLANRILKKYPDWSFWQKYVLEFKLNSLAWFLSKDGRTRLYLDYSKNNLDSGPKIEYDLGEKIGEDKVIVKKRGIRELLDLDYE
jgi:hypothetical protein